MERLLWNNYPPGEINQKVEYWVDVWDDLIEHFTKSHYGLELVDPHLILMVLIDEIEHNELRNKETRRYLLETVARFLKDDPVVRHNLSVEFSLILSGFNNQPLFYLLHSTKAALPFFRDGRYFCKTYGLLRKILGEPNWPAEDETEIELIAGSLIVELLLKGYTLNTVRSMPRNIFCSVSRKPNAFPTEFVWADFGGLPAADQQKYVDKNAEELKALNLDKRLSAFTRYFFRRPKDYIVLFEVEGLKAEAEVEIGPVTFYSPKVRSFIKDVADAKTNHLLKEQEFFRRDKNEYFANAAIRFSCVDLETGRFQAAETADKALDLLRTQYKAPCRFKVLREQYIILGQDGRIGGSGFSADNDNPVINRLHSLDLELFSQDKDHLACFAKTAQYLFLAKDAQSTLEQKVSDCLHWFRKGEETDRFEDRLLHYWIVMEKIFTFSSSSAPLIKGNDKLETKILLISEFLSASVAFEFIYRLGWTLHNYLRNLVGSDLAGILGQSRLILPREIAEKCYLQENFSGRVYLKQIVENLHELAQAVDKRLVKNRILYTERFYHDGSFAKKEIERVVARSREDVLLIYRYRNSIVHNAHYDPSLLQPFVEKAARLAQLALVMLIQERAKETLATVEQIFVSKHLGVQRILERLGKNLPVDFLEVPAWNLPSN
ncbi:MAG TPA: hypothetical protein VNZ64_08845 [Candidatus Acidoferrum sp.]|jgi:hypothetical protein|nr:hypothetical protein [Candidatus Acidoferrum sp.]